MWHAVVNNITCLIKERSLVTNNKETTNNTDWKLFFIYRRVVNFAGRLSPQTACMPIMREHLLVPVPEKPPSKSATPIPSSDNLALAAGLYYDINDITQ